MNTRNGLRGLAVALALGVTLPASAADPGAEETLILDEQGIVSLSGGIGIVSLEANEYVYQTPITDDRVSHLIWQSTAPMLNAGVDVALPDGWSLAARAQVAMGGDSYMEDYDWYGPDFISFDAADWTHRSQHDATDLDWYFNGSLLLGRDFSNDENVTINVNGGFKYTDVQWAAFGGSYVYSDGLVDNPGNNFRDYVGVESDSEAAITYRQSFPALVAGVDIETTHDAFTFGAGVQGGFTLYGVGDDHHWMRDLNFIDKLGSAPLLSARVSVGYELAEGMNLFVEGTAEKIFAGRGNDYEYDMLDGSLAAIYPDMGGGDLFAASISGGIKGSF